MSDEVVQRVAVAGTPDDALHSVRAWEAAGTSTVVLVAGADDPRNSYRRFAADVLPRVRG